MCIDIQSTRLGDIRENHCSLFHAADRIRELRSTIEELWDESFADMSDAEIFALLDRTLYLAEDQSEETLRAAYERFGHFDFLTNTGEQFDGFKTFILCAPDRQVHILYRLADDTFGAGVCSLGSFRTVASSFIGWFDEQVRTVRPPYYPVDPLSST